MMSDEENAEKKTVEAHFAAHKTRKALEKAARRCNRWAESKLLTTEEFYAGLEAVNAVTSK